MATWHEPNPSCFVPGGTIRTFKEFGLAGHQLTAEQVHDYLLYLMAERPRQRSTVNPIVAGLRFFYT